MQIITRPFFLWRWPVVFLFPASDAFLAFRAKWYIWCRWPVVNSVDYGPVSCGFSWGTDFVSPTGTFLLAWCWTQWWRGALNGEIGNKRVFPEMKHLSLFLWPQLLMLLGFVFAVMSWNFPTKSLLWVCVRQQVYLNTTREMKDSNLSRLPIYWGFPGGSDGKESA